MIFEYFPYDTFLLVYGILAGAIAFVMVRDKFWRRLVFSAAIGFVMAFAANMAIGFFEQGGWTVVVAILLIFEIIVVSRLTQPN